MRARFFGVCHIIILVTGLISTLDTWGLTPESDVAVVAAVKGKVTYWAPGAARWRVLRIKDKIPFDSLVAVNVSEYVTFVYLGENLTTKEGRERITLTVRDPMVFRINRTAVRDIKLEKEFITKIPPPFTPSSDTTIAAEAKKIADAWIRYAMVLTGDATKKIGSLVGLTLEKGSLSISANEKPKKIKLIIPTEANSYSGARWPIPLTVSWDAEGFKDVPMQIRTWPADSLPPEKPNYQTTESFHTVTYSTPGPYMVKVSSADGRWVSDSVAFNILPPIGSGTNDMKLEERTTNILIRMVLDFPVNHFESFSATDTAAIDFSWHADQAQTDNSANRRWSYHLRIVDQKTKKIRTIETIDPNVRVTLASPGRYLWYVDVVGYQGDKNDRSKIVPIVLRSSPERTIRLEKKMLAFNADLFMQAVSSQREGDSLSATIYWDQIK